MGRKDRFDMGKEEIFHQPHILGGLQGQSILKYINLALACVI